MGGVGAVIEEPDYDKVRSEVVEAMAAHLRPRQPDSIRRVSGVVASKLRARWRLLEPLSYIRFGFRRADRYAHYWMLLLLMSVIERGSEFDSYRLILDRQLDLREKS